MATPRVRVTERKLHRHKADGLAWVGGGLVELDPRLSEKYRLEVLVTVSVWTAVKENNG